jgi:hypothetical protein
VSTLRLAFGARRCVNYREGRQQREDKKGNAHTIAPEARVRWGVEGSCRRRKNRREIPTRSRLGRGRGWRVGKPSPSHVWSEGRGRRRGDEETRKSSRLGIRKGVVSRENSVRFENSPVSLGWGRAWAESEAARNARRSHVGARSKSVEKWKNSARVWGEGEAA